MKKRIAMSLAAAMAAMCACAVPTVTDEAARQRFPWNGLVDITCKVSGIDETTQWKFVLAAVMPESGEAREVSHFWVVRDGTNSTDRAVHTNGDYRIVWDAHADLGAVVYSNMVMRVSVVDIHGRVQLWEGGPYWAATNIGAEKPEDYGYYFWWGDTIGYKRVNNAWVASDESSSNFSFSEGNTPTYNKSIDTLKSEGWITADEVLAPEHDAAYVHWGGSWRTPTKQELADLNSKCSWNLTTMNGVQGYLVSGTGDYASNTIFLPCAGDGHGTSLYDAGSDGYFWSSVPNSNSSYSYNAWYTDFNLSDLYTYRDYRYSGHSVRPVQDTVYTVTYKYMVTYNPGANGDGAQQTATKTHSVALLLKGATFTRDGYTQTGWSTSDGGACEYGLCASYTMDADVTLYPFWTMNSGVDTHTKVQLWDGGPYWAATNIGAEKPEDYGYYFWWGDTIGYKRVNNAWVASDGSSSNFSFSEGNTPTYGKEIASLLKSEGWITADIVLTPEHDAAYVHWGGSWRMPTKQELSDLNSKCCWNWSTMNGVKGWVVSGMDDYASNSIFLPCAGRDDRYSFSDAGSNGYYWSSVPCSFNYAFEGAWGLDFSSGGHGTSDNSFRYFGQSVRPVQGFTE